VFWRQIRRIPAVDGDFDKGQVPRLGGVDLTEHLKNVFDIGGEKRLTADEAVRFV
jgi:hypothetical protein